MNYTTTKRRVNAQIEIFYDRTRMKTPLIFQH